MVNDDEAAAACVDLEHNAFQGQPERMALFRNLVSLLRSPWHAVGMHQELERLPPDRRQEGLQVLTRCVAGWRREKGAPTTAAALAEEAKTLAKGGRQMLLALQLRRPDQSFEQSRREVQQAYSDLFPEFKKSYSTEALRVAADLRKPGEDLADGAGALLAGVVTLKNSLEVGWIEGVDLIASIPRKDRREFLDQLEVCVPLLKGMPAAAAGDALREAFAGDSPSEALPGLLADYRLTGKVGGLPLARASLQAALDEGRIHGTLDEWMERLENRLHQLKLYQGSGSLAGVLEELISGPSAGSALGSHGGFLMVGGARLKQRGS